MQHSSNSSSIKPICAVSGVLAALVVGCGQVSLSTPPRPGEVAPPAHVGLTPTPVDSHVEAFTAGDYSACLVCHGAYGGGNAAVAAPSLIGLPEWYLRSQLYAFRVGWRGAHPQDQAGNAMYQVVRLMDDAAIIGAVRFVSTLEPIDTETGVERGAADAGRGLYDARCAGCHGDDGAGDPTRGAPPLARMHRWYLQSLLQKYASGVRGYHPDDVYGAQMKGIAQTLSPNQVDDIATYLAAFAP